MNQVADARLWRDSGTGVRRENHAQDARAT
jgi:hypothetical protein